jgi:undecaprenyl-diphosphatase
MSFIQIFVLAIVQGLAELLPVSSSAHVILAEKLMGLDPTSPDMTLLLVALHTGTMFAVIVYFWRSWRTTYFASMADFRKNGASVAVATATTGVVGLALMYLIGHAMRARAPEFQIEDLFGNTKLIATGLACAGGLILLSSRLGRERSDQVSARAALAIGAVQGLCLPLRGFSRSGATISTGLLGGIGRRRVEEFSFALAVVLTPAVIAREAYRFFRAHAQTNHASEWLQLAGPSALGMALSFFAGLAALRLLSKTLEQGRWHLFGFYCLVAAGVTLVGA